jgi:hypothetical protein
LGSLLVVPSPKSHSTEVIEPSGSLEALLENCTVSGGSPEIYLLGTLSGDSGSFTVAKAMGSWLREKETRALALAFLLSVTVSSTV